MWDELCACKHFSCDIRNMSHGLLAHMFVLSSIGTCPLGQKKRYLSWGKAVHIDSDGIKARWEAKKEPTEHRPEELHYTTCTTVVAFSSVVYADLQSSLAALRKTPKVAFATKAIAPQKQLHRT